MCCGFSEAYANRNANLTFTQTFPLVVFRDTYDRFGEEGLKREEQGGSADPFGDMFSHFGFGGGRRQREESRTPNVEVQ